MKKSKYLILVIIGMLTLVTLAGCGSKSNENKVVQSTSNIESEKFEMKYENIEITPGMVFDKNKLNEEVKVSEIPSCAFDGTDNVYTLSNLEITVANIDGEDRVYSVYFLDDEVETNEGVKITDSKQKMIDKYGNNYEQRLGNQFTYTKGNVELTFIIENEIITSIEYTLKTN